MRLLGLCSLCRRYRYVRVAGPALALAIAHSRSGGLGVPEGICHDCEGEKMPGIRRGEEMRR